MEIKKPYWKGQETSATIGALTFLITAQWEHNLGTYLILNGFLNQQCLNTGNNLIEIKQLIITMLYCKHSCQPHRPCYWGQKIPKKPNNPTIFKIFKKG